MYILTKSNIRISLDCQPLHQFASFVDSILYRNLYFIKYYNILVTAARIVEFWYYNEIIAIYHPSVRVKGI